MAYLQLSLHFKEPILCNKVLILLLGPTRMGLHALMFPSVNISQPLQAVLAMSHPLIMSFNNTTQPCLFFCVCFGSELFKSSGRQ